MNYSITQIEDAIIDTLKKSVMNEYCKKIDSYQIEGGDIEEQVRLFSGRLPCALVVYSKGDYTHFPNRRQDKEMTFQILVCSESLRSPDEARKGAVGTYKMLEDLRATLTGSRVGLDIIPLTPVSESAEINVKGFSAYSMEFKTKCALTF
jgi:hypothetical protein